MNEQKVEINIEIAEPTEAWKNLFDYIFEDHDPSQINQILYLCNEHHKQATRAQLQKLLEEAEERIVDNSDHDQGVEGWNSAIGEVLSLITSTLNTNSK